MLRARKIEAAGRYGRAVTNRETLFIGNSAAGLRRVGDDDEIAPRRQKSCQNTRYWATTPPHCRIPLSKFTAPLVPPKPKYVRLSSIQLDPTPAGRGKISRLLKM